MDKEPALYVAKMPIRTMRVLRTAAAQLDTTIKALVIAAIDRCYAKYDGIAAKNVDSEER